MGRTILLGLAALTSLWMLEGVMAIDQGEAAVVFRFGAPARTASAGLHLRAPWPIETHTVVRMAEVRRVETGAQRMLTGDTNLVDLALVVQYTVGDPLAHELSLRAPSAVVIAEVIAAATAVVSTMDVDRLLTTGRAELQQRVVTLSQERLDALRSGLRLDDVEVAELGPPPAVVDAFNDVSSARGDRETLALGAEAYASTVVPDARGAAAQKIEAARADASRRVAGATAEVERFSLLSEAAHGGAAAVRAALIAQTAARVGEQAHVIVARPGDRVHLPSLPDTTDGR